MKSVIVLLRYRKKVTIIKVAVVTWRRIQSQKLELTGRERSIFFGNTFTNHFRDSISIQINYIFLIFINGE